MYLADWQCIDGFSPPIHVGFTKLRIPACIQLLWKILVSWDHYSQYMEKQCLNIGPTINFIIWNQFRDWLWRIDCSFFGALLPALLLVVQICLYCPHNFWLVVWNMFFFHILGIMIPTDSYFLEEFKPPTSKSSFAMGHFLELCQMTGG